MVAVFNKELLSWYLITLKIKETVEAGKAQQSPTSESQLKLLQHQTSRDQVNTISIKDGGKTYEEESNSPKNEWIISIKDKLEQARQDEDAGAWAKHCIYRIPKCLRNHDDNTAFVPQIVSLGPYHHDRKKLKDMNRHKWRSLHQVLKRTGHDIKVYLNSIKDLEERARACYEDSFNLSSNDFVEMMVLDGIFILELFRGVAEGFKQLGYLRNDPIFAMRSTMHSIQRDMIMLENQLPLFILDRLLGLQIGDPDQKGFVAKLIIRFFDPLTPTDEPLRKSDRSKLESTLGYSNSNIFDPLTEHGGLHCIDVFRRSLLRTGPQPTPKIWMKRRSSHHVPDKRRMELVHCVTELKEAGVKFKKRKTDRFWDITFKDGVLWMPRLLIHDGTKSLFLNLIAFEQCQIDCSNDITSYVVFMDNLINSAQDVGYLHYCGIIEHWLGSDSEVSDLFNRICQEVVFDINSSYLAGLSDQVNRYYDHKWNTWLASLRHNYFNNPWAILSFFAAVVLLVLTFVQTFYSVYGYYRPAN